MRNVYKKVLTIFLIIIGIVIIILALPYKQYRREIQATKASLLANSEILNTDNITIEYSIQGEGTPVLTLHGAGGGYDQGLWLGKTVLGDGYKFISVSRYGYLGTPIPDDASIRTQAALYKELLDHLNIPEVIVVGTSAGGPSATQFANDYPEMTSALILYSAVSKGPDPSDKPPFYVGIIHLIQQSDYMYWLVARYMQSAILDLVGVPADVYANFSSDEKQIAQEMLDVMHPMSERYPGTINDEIMIRQEIVPTDAITAPTLILHARDDALVSFHHAEYAHDTIPDSRLILYDTGGHGLLSRLSELRQEVDEFLETI